MREMLLATLARLIGQEISQDATLEEITEQINKALEDIQ